MKRFRIKLTEAKRVMDLNDTLELRDDVVVKTVHENNSNPICNMDAESQCVGGENIYYFDDDGTPYSKEFLDMYYERIE